MLRSPYILLTRLTMQTATVLRQLRMILSMVQQHDGFFISPFIPGLRNILVAGLEKKFCSPSLLSFQ